MKQNLRLITLCFISAFAANWTFAQKDASWIGDYAATTNFTISTPAQLKALADTVNAASNALNFSGKTIVLANDIDLKGYSDWSPIGYVKTTSPNLYRPFKGTFNGNNHIIANVKIVASGSPIYHTFGLFGHTDAATLKNIIVEDSIVNVTGSNIDYAGGLVAYAIGGTIDSCVSFGQINVKIYTDNCSAGGLIGYANGGSVQHCANYSNVTTVRSSPNSIATGGIVGKTNDATAVSYCYNQGLISSDFGKVGGIIGDRAGTISTIQNCFNTGNITANGTTSYAGGILGYTNLSGSAISYSYNIGTIVANTNTGGIVGYAQTVGIPEKCYFDYCQSGVHIPKGNLTSDSTGRRHTIDMFGQATYTTWDFATIWTTDNNAYPYFAWLLDDRDADGNYLFEQTIAVMPQPTLTLPANGNLCQGDSLLLTFTGSEDFSLTGTGLPATIAPTDSAVHTVSEVCGQLYRTYTVKIPIQTTGNFSINITSLADALCTNTTGVTGAYTVNPKPAFTLTAATFCEGATVPITITGANSSAITYNIVGKNDCDKCGGIDKWVAMGLSAPTTNGSGSYSGNITGTSNGNWTFHVNSVTIAGCTITNPNPQAITSCP
ncbi:hypothetical protein FACS1894178_8220 [Bacteroidia bacterium]|nr:hypothetical protein FACS1894178_8220 [Bacteroidia bacterium]